MNLSCSGGGLPESGCLFFKVGASTLREWNFGYVTNGRNILKYSVVSIESLLHS